MEIKRTKFNISLLGEGNVGKTSLISVYIGHEFEIDTLKTVGLDNYLAKEKYDGENYKFKVFDTAGQERYKSISKSTIQVADGFLLVYSVSDRNSFDLLNEWLMAISEQCDISRKVLFLVGNKIDVEKREVSNEEAVAFAKNKNIFYCETSAKTRFGVKEAFQKLFYAVYQKYKELKNIDNEQNNNNDNKQTGNIELDKKILKKRDKKSGCC